MTATAQMPARTAVPFHRPGEPGYRRLVVALFTASVATFAALYSTQSLIRTLSRAFTISDAQATLSVSVATLTVGFGMLIAGPLSERWGRTAVIKTSLTATALLTLAGAFAPSWPVLLIIRALEGFALSGTPAVALVYLREEVHASVHPRATGLYIGGTALGGMTGRLLTGGVADLTDWRWALGAIAALCGFCALVVVLVLPDARHRPARTAPRGARGAGSGAWGSARRALSDRRLLGIYAVAATAMGAFVAVYNVLGLRLQGPGYGLSTFGASLVFCVYPLGSVSSALAGRAAERVGRAPVVIGGCLLAILGVLITLASPLAVIILGVALITVGFFAAHGVASGWAVAVGGQNGVASAASSFYLLSYYIGSSVFGALSGSVWAADGWSAVVVMVGVLFACAVAVASTQARSRQTIS